MDTSFVATESQTYPPLGSRNDQSSDIKRVRKELVEAYCQFPVGIHILKSWYTDAKNSSLDYDLSDDRYIPPTARNAYRTSCSEAVRLCQTIERASQASGSIVPGISPLRIQYPELFSQTKTNLINLILGLSQPGQNLRAAIIPPDVFLIGLGDFLQSERESTSSDLQPILDGMASKLVKFRRLIEKSAGPAIMEDIAARAIRDDSTPGIRVRTLSREETERAERSVTTFTTLPRLGSPTTARHQSVERPKQVTSYHAQSGTLPLPASTPDGLSRTMPPSAPASAAPEFASIEASPEAAPAPRPPYQIIELLNNQPVFLKDFQNLSFKMPELLAKLEEKGIDRRSRLVSALQNMGINNAAALLGDFLEGHVLSERSRIPQPTKLASAIATIAEIKAEDAYAQLLSASGPAAAPKDNFIELDHGQPAHLRYFRAIAEDMPDLLAELEAKGFETRRKLMAGLTAMGINSINCAQGMPAFLEGHIFSIKQPRRLTKIAEQVAALVKMDPAIAYAKIKQPIQPPAASPSALPPGDPTDKIDSPSDNSYRPIELFANQPLFLRDFKFIAEKLPELLAKLEAKSLGTRRKLISALVTNGMSLKNIHMSMSDFLEGHVFSRAPGHKNVTKLAAAIAAIADLDPAIAYARLRVEETPTAKIAKDSVAKRPGPTLVKALAPPDGESHLYKIAFLVQKAPELLVGLLNHGIITRANVENLYQSTGASPEESVKRAKIVLGGKVLKGNLSPTKDAVVLANAAEVDCWTAYHQCVKAKFEKALNRKPRPSLEILRTA